MKAFATMQLRRAKYDRIDAALIAAFTALVTESQRERAAPDQPLQPLADRLVFIEHAIEDASRAKLCMKHQTDPPLRRQPNADGRRAAKWAEQEVDRLAAAVGAEPDLVDRLDLALLIPGLGLKTAPRLIVLMPELGSLSREQA